MNSRPPLTESLGTPVISPGWSNWLTQVFLSLVWKQGYNFTATLDFGATPAQSQTSLTFTITGVRPGDSVQITPTTDVSGIIFTGVVTADNVVTVYAKNFTTGSINPASQVFRLLALQN